MILAEISNLLINKPFMLVINVNHAEFAFVFTKLYTDVKISAVYEQLTVFVTVLAKYYFISPLKRSSHF